MEKAKLKKADLGRHKREFLVRLPEARYEALFRFADENGTSLSYQVNEAIRAMLIKAESEQEVNGR